MTSTPLFAHRRLQFSIAIHKVDAIDLTQDIPTVVLPILWIDEVCSYRMPVSVSVVQQFLSTRCAEIDSNMSGKVYSLEYTDIPKVLFMRHHIGYCCINVI
jgi:hypothetical protein